MRILNSRAAARFAASVWLLGGCSTDATNTAAVGCERDAELMTRAGSCLSTRDCPCGTRCEFGLCTYDCTSDGECSGGPCNSFGQCRSETDVSSGPTPAMGLENTDDNFVQVMPNVVRFSPGQAITSVVARMGNAQDRAEVRVRSSSPVNRVSCGSEGFGDSCTFTLTRDRPSLTLRVQRLDSVEPGPEADALPGAAPGLQISTRYRTRMIPLIEDESPPAGVRPGVYEGRAVLREVSRGDVRTRTNDEQDGVPASFPVRVIVAPAAEDGALLVAIDDPAALFGGNVQPDGSHWATGVLRPDSDSPSGWAFSSEGAFPAVDVDRPGLGIFRAVATNLVATLPGSGQNDRLVLEVAQDVRFAPGPPTVRLQFRVHADWRTPELPAVRSGRPAADTVAQQATPEWVLRGTDRFAESQRLVAVDATDFVRAQDMACGQGSVPAAFDLSLVRVEVPGPFTTELLEAFDGELGCNDGAQGNLRMPVFPIFHAEGLVPEAYEALVVRCLAELRFDSAPVADGAECVDTSRLLAAASTALASTRPGAQRPDLPGQRFGAYLLARYLDVNGFLADTFRLQRGVRRYLDSEANDVAAGFPTGPEFILRSSEHWDVLLHPFMIEPLFELAPRALTQPDFRRDIAPDAVDESLAPSDLHELPLHVALMEDIAGQLGAWEGTTRDLYFRRFEPFDQARIRSGLQAGLRRALILYATARTLHTRALDAVPSGTQFGWTGEWRLALADVHRRLGAVVGYATAEIPPDDSKSLPYDRVGDQVGAGSRFRAMSERLLGTGEALGGTVGAELAEAERLYELATDFYGAYRRETSSFARLNLSVEDRLDYLASGVGSELTSLCGFRGLGTGDGFSAFEVEPDANACFIDPDCALRNSYRPSTAASALRVCRAAHVWEAHPGMHDDVTEPIWFRTVFTTGDAGVATILDTASFSGDGEDLNTFTITVDVGDDTWVTTAGEMETVENELRLAGASPMAFAEAEADCRALYERLSVDADSPATCQTEPSPDFQVTATRQPSCDLSVTAPLALEESSPTCFQGDLGVAWTWVLGEQVGVYESQARLQAVLDRIRVEAASCDLLQEKLERIGSTYETFLEEVKEIRSDIVKLESAIATLEAVVNCAGALQKTKNVFSGGIAAGICGAGVGLASAQITLSKFEADVENRMDQLDADLALLEAETDVRVCYNALNRFIADIGPAVAEMRGAVARFDESWTEFTALQDRAAQLFAEGAQWRASLERRRLRAVPQDYNFRRYFLTLDRAVERLQQALVSSIQAVEWELQQSLIDPSEVRSTFDLERLRALGNRLRNAVLDGRVAGGNPTEGRFVLSLRHDVLQIPFESDQGTGFHRGGDDVGLAQTLRNPRWAVYRNDGSWSGQSIPFSLAPEALERQRGAIGRVLSDRLCAEKVWGVGGLVVGANAVSIDGSRLFRMFLRKRNTFFTRACTARGEARVGYLGTANGVQEGNDADRAPDRFTSAWINAEVYRSDFVAGARAALELGTRKPSSTFELAGLGLYGDYELFVPASSLVVPELDLDEVQDVLIVFDVLAVTNNAAF